MKKTSIISIIIVFIVVVLGLVYFFGKPLYMQERQKRVTDFVTDFQKKIDKKIPITEGKEKLVDNASWIYFNTGKGGNLVQKNLEQLLPTKSQSEVKSTQQINKLHLLYPEKNVSSLKGITHLTLNEAIYNIKWLSLSKESVKEKKQLYFKDNDYNDPFNLNDLIRDKGEFRKTIDKIINNQKWSQDKKTKMIKLFEGDDWSKIPFEYKKGQLKIDDALQLSVTDFINSVQGKYLEGDALKKYQNYLEEHKDTLKRVALTFDDGPNPLTTPHVLDLLKKYNVNATFFVIGRKVAGNEKILKDIVDAGNEVENHTWDHPPLTTLSKEDMKKEVTMTSDAIEKATGQKPVFLRPPYGDTNDVVKQVTGLQEVMWTVDTLDWQNHSTAGIMSNLKKELSPGGIILMHDIHQTSLEALPTVLDYLKSEGYEVVTVSELYGYK